MRGRLLDCTFHHFQTTPENREALKAALWYADHFETMRPPENRRNGLYISGGYGTGKTYLAAAIANQLLEGGRQLIFTTVLDLLGNIRSSFDVSYAPYAPKEGELMRRYAEAPLLILDDIGSEQPTEWGVATVYAIINARYELYRPIIITTNYTDQELVQRMTPPRGDFRNAERIIDRLMECCGGIDMHGESWRRR